MASYVTPKKNTAYTFFAALVSQANTKLFQATPTLAAGDFKVSIDGGALANMTTLPTNTPSGVMVKFVLSASEMNGDNITVACSDVAGNEWCDAVFNIQTSARQVDDLAYPGTSGRSLAVDPNGVVDSDVKQLSDDSGAADNLKAILNGTGGKVKLSSGLSSDPAIDIESTNGIPVRITSDNVPTAIQIGGDVLINGGLLHSFFTGCSNIAKWLRTLARVDQVDGPTLLEINDSVGTFDPTLHSQQGLYNNMGLHGEGLDAIPGGGGGGGGDASEANQLAILAKLSGATITVNSPLNAAAELEIIQGADYLDAYGRALQLVVDDYTGFSVAGATVQLALMPVDEYNATGGAATTPISGSAAMVGPDLVIKFDVDAATTSALEPSPPSNKFNYVYQVKIVKNGHTILDRLGAATIKKHVF